MRLVAIMRLGTRETVLLVPSPARGDWTAWTEMVSDLMGNRNWHWRIPA